MASAKVLLVSVGLVFGLSVWKVRAESPSAVDLVQDVYSTCITSLSVTCVKDKAIQWVDQIKDEPEIKITEDLLVVKNNNPVNQERRISEDIIDKFEDFLECHDVIAKVPEALRNGDLSDYLPRSMQPEDLRVGLVETGRSSKLVKKVVVPFLLGLKFKTAVLVPLALSLIAMKTWKALTLGLLSLVLTGALVIFKLSKPKVNYEVIHFPHHLDHHVDHHLEHPPVGWEHSSYGRELSAQEIAYNGYRK